MSDRVQTAEEVKRTIAGTNGTEPQKELTTEELEQRLFDELLQKYDAATCSSSELEALDIPARQPLIGKWLREGDLGFVFGVRGGGKTWFINALATHLSTGRDLFDWVVPALTGVLVIDGEMPLDSSRDRLKGMSPKNPHLLVLHHERLFDMFGLTMNLADPNTQKVLTALCVNRCAKLLILDNLSCLFSGVKENDADEWEKVLNWLLDLRRRRIAVLITHHSGVSGRMRGTTRREDAAFWVIRVDPIGDRSPHEIGARFQTTFTKQRNNSSPEWTREWTFQTESNGTISIGCKELGFDEKVLQLIQDGLSSATDIAIELKVVKSTVCKAAKRLESKKLVETSGRKYKPRGFINELTK